jgi:hypothetical protein
MIQLDNAERAIALCARALKGEVVAVSDEELTVIDLMRGQARSDDPLALVPNPMRVDSQDAYLLGPADRPEMMVLGLINGLQSATRVQHE